jgi:hypothetical protein
VYLHVTARRHIREQELAFCPTTRRHLRVFELDSWFYSDMAKRGIAMACFFVCLFLSFFLSSYFAYL